MKLQRRLANIPRLGGLSVSLWAAGLHAAPISAAPNSPPLTVALRDTLDLADVPIGIRAGTAVLNKLQLSGTLRGEKVGLSGWSLHAQVIRFDGNSLSHRLGDIQTADNIEAVPFTRLFEAYLARLWRKNERSLGLRAGLIDLNSQFDSIDFASLMLNSSHGIAPDLSKSGLNGPSIYPETAFGSTATLVTSPAWTFRLGIFDAVAGSLAHPRAFLPERLRLSDGLLVIAQFDWQPTDTRRLEGGSWTYTSTQPGPEGLRSHDHGVYFSYEGPLDFLPHLEFWLRGGVADRHAQIISGYFGGGIVQRSTIPSRSDDRVGLAIAHAIVGSSAAKALGLYKAETSVELTYQARISHRFVLQPDIQYIHHPVGERGARDSVGLTLRVVYASAYPIRMAASDPGDPTVPPDGSPSEGDALGE